VAIAPRRWQIEPAHPAGDTANLNLRVKTLSSVILALAISSAVSFYIASSINRSSYETLEQQSADRDLQRLEKVFLDDLKRMFVTAEESALWDETYQFVHDRNENYIRSNFSNDTFSIPSIDLVIIVDSQGKPALSSSFKVSADVAKPALDFLLEALRPGGKLFEEDPEEYGIIAIGQHTLLIAMAPIHRSDGKGEARGIMLLGRFLTDRRLEELRVKTQLDISFRTISDLQLAPQKRAELNAIIQQMPKTNLSLDNPGHLTRQLDESTLLGHTLMPDIFGAPQVVWSVAIPRDIHQQGKEGLNILLLALTLVGLVVIVCLVVLLERLVLRPLAQLTREVAQIGSTNDLAARVASQGHDELGFLARSVNAMLEQLQESKNKLAAEHERAENLLLNILPSSIANQLKTTHGQIADSHEEVTVLFADLVGFTSISTELSPTDLVSMLNQVFSRFDDLCEELELEKIKTIGDAYMVAAGLPTGRHDHAETIAEMALRMVDTIDDYSASSALPLQVRVGINTGQVVAGVIGKKKFIYDLWGDTVNIASRMESSGKAGMIQLSVTTYHKIKHAFDVQPRGMIAIKGRGKMPTYVLKGRRSAKP